MSGFASLLDRVQRAYARISEMQALAANFPGDKYVLANLSSLKREAEELEQLWQEEAKLEEKEVCRYRIIADAGEYAVRGIAQSLLTFQDLFSQIYDAIENGVKERAIINPQIAVQTALNLAYTFPGSLGVVLTVQGESDLFSSKYEDAVRSFSSIIGIREEEQVRALAGNLGLAVVRRTYNWSKINANASYGIDYHWFSTIGTRIGGIAEVSDFARIVNIIDRVSDIDLVPFRTVGVLAAIDTIGGGGFKLIPSALAGPDVIVGVLAKEFPRSEQWAVNTDYLAELEIETTTKFATEETKKIYRLRQLINLK